MNVILEGEKLKNIEDFHKEISKLLEFPDYYGNNLDALWDCLTSWIEPPITLVWKDFEVSNLNLGDFAYKARSIFDDAEKEIDGFKVKYQ
jgi:ribonuclease inhibitor